MAVRNDSRYAPTVRDVIWVLRTRTPDPLGHNQRPWTDFLIGSCIAADRGLPPGHLGRVLRRDRLLELLGEMVASGVLVGRTRAEWAAVGREPPLRAKNILYTTKEHADAWAAAELAERQVVRGEKNPLPVDPAS